MTGQRATIAVVGAGSWGTTISHVLADRADVALWARDPVLAEELSTRRTNGRRLPGATLAAGVRVSSSVADVVAGADVVLIAVPTVGMRAVVEALAPAVGAAVPLVSLAKGFEPDTRLRM